MFTEIMLVLNLPMCEFLRKNLEITNRIDPAMADVA